MKTDPWKLLGAKKRRAKKQNKSRNIKTGVWLFW